jgi:hypothetical protein
VGSRLAASMDKFVMWIGKAKIDEVIVVEVQIIE